MDYFCAKNPKEPRCSPESQAQCYVNNQVVNSPYCFLKSCYNYFPDPDINCSATLCIGAQAQNITCQALACINAYKNNELRPECYESYTNYTFKTNFSDAKEFKIQGNIIIHQLIEKQAQQMNKWVAVGITAGCCIVLFSAILVVGICLQMNVNKNTTQLSNLNYTDGK
ncbi:Hypothetical_protein [Hexamita inflata]|uniref:Hypothetical_protein n=1 Tax=Hexamita inflata TaxID=28002 RepID=A0AA86RHK2_9EUKA|nr:Hypothetical protein HINF_LOCUS62563 [Hexamita inflata]